MAMHPGLAVMLGAPDDKDDEKDNHDEEGLSDDEHSKAKEEAAEEMISCMRKNDKGGFLKALEAIMDLHEADKEGEDEDMSDEDGKDEENEDEDELKL